MCYNRLSIQRYYFLYRKQTICTFFCALLSLICTIYGAEFNNKYTLSAVSEGLSLCVEIIEQNSTLRFSENRPRRILKPLWSLLYASVVRRNLRNLKVLKHTPYADKPAVVTNEVRWP